MHIQIGFDETRQKASGAPDSDDDDAVQPPSPGYLGLAALFSAVPPPVPGAAGSGTSSSRMQPPAAAGATSSSMPPPAAMPPPPAAAASAATSVMPPAAMPPPSAATSPSSPSDVQQPTEAPVLPIDERPAGHSNPGGKSVVKLCAIEFVSSMVLTCRAFWIAAHADDAKCEAGMGVLRTEQFAIPPAAVESTNHEVLLGSLLQRLENYVFGDKTRRHVLIAHHIDATTSESPSSPLLPSTCASATAFTTATTSLLLLPPPLPLQTDMIGVPKQRFMRRLITANKQRTNCVQWHPVATTGVAT